VGRTREKEEHSLFLTVCFLGAGMGVLRVAEVEWRAENAAACFGVS